MRKVIMASVIILVLTACTAADENVRSAPSYTVYDLSEDGTRLEADDCVLKETDLSERVGKLLQRLIDGPEGNRQRSCVPTGVTGVKYAIGAKTVGVDLNGQFDDERQMRKLLCEAAIVRTLCALDEVYAVSFSVNGVPLCDSQNIPVGLLSADSFVENEGAMINAYERAELDLFFASEDGQMLVEKVETVTYNGNVSLDRVVVDNIILGPRSTDAFATVNPATEVNSVTTQDGICYVNLSADFLNKITNVTDEVMVYSLVNSLSQLGNINKVQILIDGDTDAKLGTLDLSHMFERNLEIVTL